MKRLSKRLLSAVLVAALLLLTACGGQTASSTPAASTPAAGTPGAGAGDSQPAAGSQKLSIYLWDNEYAAQAVVEAYQTKHPEVEIDLNLTPFMDYQSKLYTSLAGGETMDVFFMREAVLTTYVSKGLCAPLDDYLASANFDMSPYEYCASQYRIDGKTYAVPYRGGGYHLYYNKDMFDEAGIPYPDMYKSYTWEEFREIAKQLTHGEGGDKVYGVYMMGWPWMQMFQAMQSGTRIVDNDYNVDIDTPEVRAALEWYYNTCVVDKSQMTPAEATATNASITPVFVGEKAAMILGGDYMAGNIKNNIKDGTMTFNWGMARCPVDEGVEYATHNVVTTACLNPNAKNPELAVDFLMFLCSEEGQTIIAEQGSKPVLSTEATRAAWLAGVEVYSEEQAELYFEGVNAFSDPQNLASGAASTVLTEELSLYMTENGQSLEDTIKNSVERLEEEISKLDIE